MSRFTDARYPRNGRCSYGGLWAWTEGVAHSIHNLHLVTVLDELRLAYELCKAEGHAELQSMLMQVRRKLLDALHETLDLYAENGELHQQLSEVQAEIRQLRARAAHLSLKEPVPGQPTRKLS